MAWFPAGSFDDVASGALPEQAVERFRDLLVTRTGESTAMVVAVDSSGAIGPKSHDHLRWTGREAGRTATKVPVMEVVAAGAVPVIVVDNLCVEMDPFGWDILEGVRDVCRELDHMPVITGSDETNMPTIQTGIGITVIASLRREDCRLGSSQAGDTVLAVGTPLGGADGATPDGGSGTATVTTVRQLLALDGVREVLPVGSKGIRYELGELAAGAGLRAEEVAQDVVDVERSAGASAVVLVSVADGSSIGPAAVGGLPCTPVGRLRV